MKSIFQVETSKFESGIANKTKRFVITCHMYRDRVFGDISGWVAKWALKQVLVFCFFFICLLTMCRALFIQNEKADTIHRIPLILSNQVSFPAYTHLNIHPHQLRVASSANYLPIVALFGSDDINMNLKVEKSVFSSFIDFSSTLSRSISMFLCFIYFSFCTYMQSVPGLLVPPKLQALVRSGWRDTTFRWFIFVFVCNTVHNITGRLGKTSPQLRKGIHGGLLLPPTSDYCLPAAYLSPSCGSSGAGAAAAELLGMPARRTKM